MSKDNTEKREARQIDRLALAKAVAGVLDLLGESSDSADLRDLVSILEMAGNIISPSGYRVSVDIELIPIKQS